MVTLRPSNKVPERQFYMSAYGHKAAERGCLQLRRYWGIPHDTNCQFG